MKYYEFDYLKLESTYYVKIAKRGYGRKMWERECKMKMSKKDEKMLSDLNQIRLHLQGERDDISDIKTDLIKDVEKISVIINDVGDVTDEICYLLKLIDKLEKVVGDKYDS